MIISYLIFACNEHKELEKLLAKLTDFVQEPNEVMVILDDENTTDEVMDVVKKYENEIGCYAHKLNGDFASHKNFGNLCCKGDWIFQIDADEIPNDSLLMALHPMLELNPGAELIYIPRINTVDGLTEAGMSASKFGMTNIFRSGDGKSMKMAGLTFRITKHVFIKIILQKFSGKMRFTRL